MAWITAIWGWITLGWSKHRQAVWEIEQLRHQLEIVQRQLIANQEALDAAEDEAQAARQKAAEYLTQSNQAYQEHIGDLRRIADREAYLARARPIFEPNGVFAPEPEPAHPIGPGAPTVQGRVRKREIDAKLRAMFQGHLQGELSQPETSEPFDPGDLAN